MENLKFIKRGSVKDIYQLNNNELVFSYTDQYSIFDWGAMPDLLKLKGENQAMLAKDFFNYFSVPKNWQETKKKLASNWADHPLMHQLEKRGLRTHYRGEINGEIEEDLNPKQCMRVEKFEVIKPRSSTLNDSKFMDYTAYGPRVINTMVPLEVIFRFGVPKGSSILSRYKNNELYFSSIGINKCPSIGEEFDFPIIEFSTKLEDQDRMLTYEEAKSISGLSHAEFSKLKDLTTLMAFHLKNLFSNSMIKIWDGKFEFAYIESENKNERDFCMIDSLGLDELRLTYGQMPLSKEMIRQFYTGSSWHMALQEAKLISKKRSIVDFKMLTKEIWPKGPSPLLDNSRKLVEKMYEMVSYEISDLINLKRSRYGVKDWDQLYKNYNDSLQTSCPSHLWHGEFQGTI